MINGVDPVAVMWEVVVIALLILSPFFLLGGLFYFWILWYRHRDREEHSLRMVCLQVAVPRDNEIKIDAMEQIFGSLYSIKKGKKGPFPDFFIAAYKF
jgi:hypothetical protein